MEAKKKRMQELVELLNRARRAYEQEDTEIMSNYEYDRYMTNWKDWSGSWGRLLHPVLRLMWDMRCSVSCRRSGMKNRCSHWIRQKTWNS